MGYTLGSRARQSIVRCSISDRLLALMERTEFVRHLVPDWSRLLASGSHGACHVLGSGIYLSGTDGQPSNSRGVYHQNPCPEVCLFSVRPRVLRWPASDPRGVHRMPGRDCSSDTGSSTCL